MINKVSVTNDNMILVQNNHTLNANDYGQTLKAVTPKPYKATKRLKLQEN
ncbi:hypothetical protein [Capnocytophaga stomatis]|nr:hypothetical protein [Capnocytophaga stomatis]